MPRRGRVLSSDTRAIRRASRLVGVQITIASAALVLAVLALVFAFVLTEIKPAELFEPIPDPNMIDVSANTLLVAGFVVGAIAIVLAGTMSWLVTRRAVRPLGEALRIQRDFVADASHELRTPLTVLDARLQILQRSLGEGDPSAATVAELRQDAKALIDIVNDLLDVAEVAGTASTARTAVAVYPAVESTVSSMRILGASHEVRIELSEPDPVLATLPAASIHRCVGALLDNAIRHSAAGSVVTVSVTSTKTQAVVTVEDHGTGIRGIAPARIFDRFARSGPATDGGGDARSGFGIGLALVRDIAVGHGGAVEVIETSERGTTITLRVPRVQGR